MKLGILEHQIRRKIISFYFGTSADANEPKNAKPTLSISWRTGKFKTQACYELENLKLSAKKYYRFLLWDNAAQNNVGNCYHMATDNSRSRSEHVPSNRW